MPTFEIPDGPATIEAARSGDPESPQPALASAVYSVTNTSSESVDGRLGVVVSGGSKAEWFTVDGDRERSFGAGESQTATIKVAFPPDVAAGEYPFRLRVVAINDPDNDHAEGPMTTARLAAGGGGKKPRSWRWLWILLGIVAAIAIAAALYFALSGPGKPVGTTEALALARKQSAEWSAAYSKGDLDALAKMSKPPFFLDDGAPMQSQNDVRKKYQTELFPTSAQLPAGTESKDKGEVDGPSSFEASGASLISQFRQGIGKNPEFDAVIKGAKLGDDDVVVIDLSQGVATVLFFRRTGRGVELAAVTH